MALEIGSGSSVASYQSTLTGAPKKADPEADALGRALQAGDLTAARAKPSRKSQPICRPEP